VAEFRQCPAKCSAQQWDLPNSKIDCIPEWMNCLRKIPGGLDATECLSIGLDSAA
jgi:hypothetical protein